MRRAALARLLQIALLLPLLSFVGFALVEAVPGDPELQRLSADPRITDAQLEAHRRRLGLDRSIPERYACWLIGQRATTCAWWPGGQGLLRGDLGVSRAHRRPVATLLGERAGRTLGLTLPAFALALALALPLGAWAGLRRGERVDRVVSAAGLAGLSAPVHWLALLAVLGFGLGLGWLPTSGVEDPRAPGLGSRLEHAALPVFVTTLFYASRWLRYVRAAVAEVLGQPFVLALRARGVPEARVARHALRAALPPVLTVIGHSLPGLVSGSVVIERVFAYPGMGTLLLDAVLGGDHRVAVVLTLLLSAVTLLAALLADLLVVLADPRIRAEGLR